MSADYLDDIDTVITAEMPASMRPRLNAADKIDLGIVATGVVASMRPRLNAVPSVAT